MYMNKRLISVLLAAVMMLSIGITAQAKTSTVVNSIDGNLHTMAVKSDITRWGWGLNLYGELGLGSTKNQLEPKKITDNVVAVSTSVSSAAFNGYVWSLNPDGGEDTDNDDGWVMQA